QKRFSTYLVSSDPIEILFLNVGVLLVFNEKMLCIFFISIAPIGNRICLFIGIGHLSAVLQLIGVKVGRRIIFDMYHIASSFKYKCFETFFGEFFCRPSATCSRTNDNRIKCARLHTIYI